MSQNQQPTYPHASGDVTVIGPECFADEAGEVICWKGDNYRRDGQVALDQKRRIDALEKRLETLESARDSHGLGQTTARMSSPRYWS